MSARLFPPPAARFPCARNDSRDISRRHDLTLHFIGEDVEVIVTRSNETVVGMLNVEQLAVGSDDGVGIERRRALQFANLVRNHIATLAQSNAPGNGAN